MNASEIVKRYQQGERDFQYVNLKGQSFKGQELSGTDFSHADIRGTNFKGAILRGVKFRDAKAGLEKHWTITLVLISWLISGLSAFLSWIIAYLLTTNQLVGLIGSIFLFIFYILALNRGLMVGAKFIIKIICLAGVVALVGLFIGSGFIIGVILFMTLALVFLETVNVAVAVAITVAVAEVRAGVGVVAVAVVIALGAVFSAFSAEVAVVVSIAGTAIGGFLGLRAMKGNPREAWIRKIALIFASYQGTSFYNADLIGADFTGATIKNADLRAKSSNWGLLEGYTYTNRANNLEDEDKKLAIAVILAVLAVCIFILPSFLVQQNSPRESEAKTNVGIISRAQQYFFIEKNQFSRDLLTLDINIKPETTNYTYKTEAYNSGNNSYAIVTATPKHSSLKSYIGGVFLKIVPSTNQLITISILCESTQPSTSPPSPPKLVGTELQCTSGSTSVAKYELEGYELEVPSGT